MPGLMVTHPLVTNNIPQVPPPSPLELGWISSAHRRRGVCVCVCLDSESRIHTGLGECGGDEPSQDGRQLSGEKSMLNLWAVRILEDAE